MYGFRRDGLFNRESKDGCSDGLWVVKIGWSYGWWEADTTIQ